MQLHRFFLFVFLIGMHSLNSVTLKTTFITLTSKDSPELQLHVPMECLLRSLKNNIPLSNEAILTMLTIQEENQRIIVKPNDNHLSVFNKKNPHQEPITFPLPNNLLDHISYSYICKIKDSDLPKTPHILPTQIKILNISVLKHNFLNNSRKKITLKAAEISPNGKINVLLENNTQISFDSTQRSAFDETILMIEINNETEKLSGFVKQTIQKLILQQTNSYLIKKNLIIVHDLIHKAIINTEEKIETLKSLVFLGLQEQKIFEIPAPIFEYLQIINEKIRCLKTNLETQIESAVETAKNRRKQLLKETQVEMDEMANETILFESYQEDSSDFEEEEILLENEISNQEWEELLSNNFKHRRKLLINSLVNDEISPKPKGTPKLEQLKIINANNENFNNPKKSKELIKLSENEELERSELYSLAETYQEELEMFYKEYFLHLQELDNIEKATTTILDKILSIQKTKASFINKTLSLKQLTMSKKFEIIENLKFSANNKVLILYKNFIEQDFKQTCLDNHLIIKNIKEALYEKINFSEKSLKMVNAIIKIEAEWLRKNSCTSQPSSCPPCLGTAILKEYLLNIHVSLEHKKLLQEKLIVLEKEISKFEGF